MQATLVEEDKKRRYSVWYKPAGLLTQGTLKGDHCSLVRQVRDPFPLATISGLVMI